MRQRRYPKLFDGDVAKFTEKATDLHHWLGNSLRYLTLSGDHAKAIGQLQSDIRKAIVDVTGDPVVPWAKMPTADSYPGPKLNQKEKGN